MATKMLLARLSRTTLGSTTSIQQIQNRTSVLNQPLLFRANKTAERKLGRSKFFARFASDEGNQPVPGSKEYFDDIVTANPVTLFMKGTPDEPRCGFSRGVVQILEMHQIPIHRSVNVLDDEAVRAGIKEYSDWPTIPQLYLGGEFIGGFDICLDLHKSGEICEEFKRIELKSAIEHEYAIRDEQEKKAKEAEENDKKDQ